MRKPLVLLLWLLLVSWAKAQDTTQITFSQEPDTLTRQRFIDRYENVFMTKIPTRHMVKVGLSQYQQVQLTPLMNEQVIDNISLLVGYEFKFLPSFSVAVSGHLPVNQSHEFSHYILIDGQLRWFFDMRKRIKSRKSANNFSGNYISLFYNSPLTNRWNAGIGLKIGFQRRFLNSGVLDFSFALRQEKQFFYYGLLHDWTFSSQVGFGFAFGDWKKSANPPLCDILYCNQEVRHQWKIRLPETTIGYYNNKIRIGIAYEKKIADLPLSLNFQIDAAFNRGFHRISQDYEPLPRELVQMYSSEHSASFSIQPRYYLLMKKRQLQGKNTNGLSGLYTGANAEYFYYNGKHGAYITELRRKDHVLNAGPLLGFQLRLFQNGFFDCNTSYNYQDYLASTKSDFGFRTKVSLGLAF
ncbi:hypothetical protein [Dyadobacter crusticola]|uniref:hypothetical protein n=1 Tax=Dyadobacter crusticola TaxID=292407 RepID=UPI0004E229B2|nr:hypothetical protein [Dyadobacter crusticola]